ncbi:uncharacterized protein PGTG_12619 [Puccinia graminis f. sp. tritici CRL 75-36-700-3]|uniref:Uncharacterized protein n=1 Tax=Puccinia graminis f. sp. tritici (strain CRL 75-36-700-3 / race SCCL) TaxID=418459 RepID=E3KRF3_PUCGT|nr:uncharacterized protein PGTG_12619 [Puccinia graminis f. sp. tritici CRL 75-36-700-3]EFP86878.1 hypothetical protein PGTG_12619 [Puccinia graminis f. sp. tritici CRL 75-36-700-3]
MITNQKKKTSGVGDAYWRAENKRTRGISTYDGSDDDAENVGSTVKVHHRHHMYNNKNWEKSYSSPRSSVHGWSGVGVGSSGESTTTGPKKNIVAACLIGGSDMCASHASVETQAILWIVGASTRHVQQQQQFSLCKQVLPGSRSAELQRTIPCSPVDD